MADAESALREEIEKVRERARAQAVSLGLNEEMADSRGDAAVEEFCARWGIKPEMLGAAPHRSAPSRPAAPPPSPTRGGLPPLPAPASPPPTRPAGNPTVDLGSSAFRAAIQKAREDAASGGTKIAHLLDKARKVAADRQGLASTGFTGARPAAGAPPPGAGSSLAQLVSRVRGEEVPDPASGGDAVDAGTPSGPRAASSLPRLGGLFAGRNEGAIRQREEQRRQILDEFDRTYAEVQSMLDQRIGIVDVALDAGQVLPAPATGKAPVPGSIPPEEIVKIAEDLDRLMGDLQQMMALCEGLVSRLHGVLSTYEPGSVEGLPPGGPPGEGGLQ